jgi:hypothetical protein
MAAVNQAIFSGESIGYTLKKSTVAMLAFHDIGPVHPYMLHPGRGPFSP